MDSITVTDVLLLPLILIFFGCFVYGVAFGNGVRSHQLPLYRWVGVGLLAISVMLGALAVWKMLQPGLGVFYRASLQGRKVVAAHYVSLVLPLVLVGAAFAMESWFKRYRREMA